MECGQCGGYRPVQGGSRQGYKGCERMRGVEPYGHCGADVVEHGGQQREGCGEGHNNMKFFALLK